ncbi:MAG: PilN domain-containing protein [Nitrospirota bacterium]|nr:PilN domain-containing protein [Nitrospirota bacterium]
MKRPKDYINLMPKAAPTPRRVPGPAAVAGALFVLGWAAAFGWQWKEQLDLRERLAFESLTKQERLRQLDALYRELGIAGPGGVSAERATLIIGLMNERVEWSEVFRQFSLIAPAGLWFDSVEGKAGERAEITIRGGALTYATVSDFLRSMQKTGYFLTPQLVYAQKIRIQGQDAIGFEILSAIRKGKGAK